MIYRQIDEVQGMSLRDYIDIRLKEWTTSPYSHNTSKADDLGPQEALKNGIIKEESEPGTAMGGREHSESGMTGSFRAQNLTSS